MARTVIGLYDRTEDARATVRDLVDHGFERDNISFMTRQTTGETRAVGERETRGEQVAESAGAGAGIGAVVGGIGGLLVGLGALAIPGIGPLVAAGPIITTIAGAGVGAGVGTLIGALVGLGVPREEAEYYAEGVRRGGTLVAVKTTDDMASRAADIMDNHNPVDIDERAAAWRAEGWTREDLGVEETTTTTRTRPVTTRRETREERPVARETDRSVKLGKEELRVGKREVHEGGVRVRTHVIEEPVEEQVHLRDEDVRVERHPVDRPASREDLEEAFTEEEIEMRERHEEPVVSKEARVTEEIELEKDVEERTETVRDTVRRTEAEIEEVGAESERVVAERDRDLDRVYRTHYDRVYATRGQAYDRYLPAYRWGYDLATSDEWRGRDWNAVMSEIRQRWEARNPGTWNEFNEAIHEGWNQGRGRTMARGV